MFVVPVTTAEVYAIKCKTPGHYYIGRTYRSDRTLREEEHTGGHVVWTRRHGIDRYVVRYEVPFAEMRQAENDLTAWFCKRYGYHGVRGGDFTFAKLAPGSKEPLPVPQWVFDIMASHGCGNLRERFGSTSRFD